MKRPSLTALAVASVLATLGHGATAASWTQVRANEIIGAQESGEAPALQDVDLKLDESTFPYGASAMAVEVAGTREASAVHNSLTLTLRQSPSFYLDHLIGAEVSARSEDHAVRALGRGNTVNLALDDSSTLILDRITGADVWVSGPQGSVAQAGDNHVVVTGDIKLMRSAHGARVSAACEGCEAIASGNLLTIKADAFEEMWIAAQMRMAGAEVSAWGAAQASDNTLSVEAKTITASGRWVGASVESYASALAQGNELNVIADELIASSSPGEGITEFSGSLVDGPTGAAYGSRVNMQIGNVSVQEMAIYGAQVSCESAEALNNRVAVRFDELSAERLNLYGARAETWPASMSEQTSAQAIASGNELSVVFGTVHGDSDITAAAGKAEASGQNAVSVADGNSTTIEIDEIVASSSVPIIDIQGGVSSAGNEMGDPLSLSAQASASGNELSGVFGSVNSQSTDYVNLVAGNALAYGQNAVAAADSNRLTFDVSSLLSSQHFAVTGGMSVTGLANAASLFLSARASASGNAVSGRFESIRNSDISMVAGSAVAYGQDAVSSADGNRLSFEIETSVSNSTLEVQGGRATAGIASGDLQSAQASASGNLVTGVISGSVDQSLALGIYSGQAVAAAQNSSAVADNNRVQLSLEGVVADSPVSLLLSGAVVQAQTRAAAGGNLVVVSGKDTAVEGTLNGAQVTVQRSGTESSYADASGNRVEVSGIKLTGSITGAQVRNENQLGSAVAEGNVVVISNSTIEDNVTGANLLGSHINASGNTVILGEGTVVNGNVTAVVSANAELARSSGGESAGTYIDNRVVMNNATVSGAVSVVSSNSGSSQVDIQTAGNTLVLAGHNEAGWIEGFDRLDMTLSSKDESVLTLTERHESSVDGASIVIRVNV